MRLTLITVTYNNVNTIEQTINSVRDQKFENLEYLVIDGGSTDETLKLIKQNQDLVTNWISEPDKGMYYAMNKGIEMASGDIIGFLHADDKFNYPSVLKNVYDLFIGEKADFVYGDLQYVSKNNNERVVRDWKSGEFNIKKLKKGWMPPHTTVYFKKILSDEYGSFNTAYQIAADYEWMLRVLKNPGLHISYLPKILVQMKLGGVSNRSINNIILKTKEDYKAIKLHLNSGLYTLFLKNIRKIGQFF